MLLLLASSLLTYEIVQHEIIEAKKRAIARAIAVKVREGGRVLADERKALGL
jgi:hypothetical protein